MKGAWAGLQRIASGQLVTVEFQVADLDSREPIADAELVLDSGVRGVSNKAGKISFQVEPGSYGYHIEAPGYVPQQSMSNLVVDEEA